MNILIINELGIFLNKDINTENLVLRLDRQARPDASWEQSFIPWDLIKTHLYDGECVYLEKDKDHISIVIEDLQYVNLARINSSYITIKKLDEDPIELIEQTLLKSVIW